MVRFDIVSKIIGQLLFLEGGMMLSCLVMALCYREDDAMAFLISMMLTICSGLIFKYLGRNAGALCDQLFIFAENVKSAAADIAEAQQSDLYCFHA